MIKVTVSKNVGNPVDIVVPKTTTIRQILEQQNLSYANAFIMVSGAVVRDLDATLEALGVTDSCFLTCTIKADAGR